MFSEDSIPPGVSGILRYSDPENVVSLVPWESVEQDPLPDRSRRSSEQNRSTEQPLNTKQDLNTDQELNTEQDLNTDQDESTTSENISGQDSIPPSVYPAIHGSDDLPYLTQTTV